MYLYIQLWNPRPSWFTLSRSEREAVIARLLPELKELENEGAEMVGWGERDEDTPSPVAAQFFAVWKVPSKAFAKTFERIFDEAEWNVYFEQANCRGLQEAHELVLNEMCIL